MGVNDVIIKNNSISNIFSQEGSENREFIKEGRGLSNIIIDANTFTGLHSGIVINAQGLGSSNYSLNVDESVTNLQILNNNFMQVKLPVNFHNRINDDSANDEIKNKFVFDASKKEIIILYKNIEITNGNPAYSVNYFLSQIEAESNISPLPTIYTNNSNPQLLHVRVTDINTTCFSLTTLELNVVSAPSANVPPNLAYCDADADGFGIFDLSALDTDISAVDTHLFISYHETLSDA